MRSLLSLLTTLFFTACVSVPNSIPEQQSGQQTMTSGVSWGYPHKGREFPGLFEISNTGWIRIDLSWGKVEPQQGESFYDELDAFLLMCQENDIKVVGVLGFDTDWLHPDPKGKIREIFPQEMELFQNYVERVVTRYQDQVDEWEIWNEPNLPFRIFWTGKQRDFFKLTEQTISTIRHIDPDAFILGAVLWRHDPLYIRRMFRYNNFKELDAISFHPYYVSPRRVYQATSALKNSLEQVGYKGEIRVSEVGFPTGGLYLSQCKPEEQARYVMETLFYLDIQSLPYSIWYNLYDDEITSPWKSENHFGLYNGTTDKQFSYKPGGWAYQLYGQWINGKIAAPEILNKDNLSENRWLLGAYQEQDNKDEAVLLVISKRKSQDLVINGFLSGLLWNGKTGESSPVIPGDTIRVERNSPLIFSLQSVGSEGIILSHE